MDQARQGTGNQKQEQSQSKTDHPDPIRIGGKVLNGQLQRLLKKVVLPDHVDAATAIK